MEGTSLTDKQNTNRRHLVRAGAKETMSQAMMIAALRRFRNSGAMLDPLGLRLNCSIVIGCVCAPRLLAEKVEGKLQSSKGGRVKRWEGQEVVKRAQFQKTLSEREDLFAFKVGHFYDSVRKSSRYV
jgi:hypothetical protein